MLKSRRRLLAAGLAVAVAGAIGVASTLNAGAEQIPGAPDSTTAADTSAPDAAAPPAPDAVIPPPAVLPWGERPQRIKKGRAGATSKTLRASGLAAADADTSGSDDPRPRFAPKGRSNRTGFLKTEETTIAPPEPAPTASASPSGEKKVNYIYSLARQPAETDGVYANVSIAKPKLLDGDYHSLAEIALQSADGQQIVEVGWNVDRQVNGDDDPHLFVYRWVNRKPSCYNGCGFVQYSKTVKPGDTLPYDVAKKFGIQYSNGAWWIAYDTEWVGYFPESLWIKEGDVKFDRTGLVQLFGEVAAGKSRSCSQMGNAQTADNENAARFSSITYLNGPTVALELRNTLDVYTITPVTSRWFRYGGPRLTEAPEDKTKPRDPNLCYEDQAP